MNQHLLTGYDGHRMRLFEGKRIVPLDRDGESYREWSMNVADTQYCIVNEGDTWTLLYATHETHEWCEVPTDVGLFLTRNRLILAA